MLSHHGNALARSAMEVRVTEWHERPGADILLRLGGAVLLALAYAAATALRHRAIVDVRLEDDALAYLLAASTFLCASLGCASLILGRHLFDRVEIARRWRSSRGKDWGD